MLLLVVVHHFYPCPYLFPSHHQRWVLSSFSLFSSGSSIGMIFEEFFHHHFQCIASEKKNTLIYFKWGFLSHFTIFFIRFIHICTRTIIIIFNVLDRKWYPPSNYWYKHSSKVSVRFLCLWCFCWFICYTSLIFSIGNVLPGISWTGLFVKSKWKIFIVSTLSSGSSSSLTISYVTITVSILCVEKS